LKTDFDPRQNANRSEGGIKAPNRKKYGQGNRWQSARVHVIVALGITGEL
jgi:hypothetical protein